MDSVSVCGEFIPGTRPDARNNRYTARFSAATTVLHIKAVVPRRRGRVSTPHADAVNNCSIRRDRKRQPADVRTNWSWYSPTVYAVVSPGPSPL
jgi:hypothetical protein